MSKTTENILLVPGETGWEIWIGQDPAALTMHEASSTDRAGDLANLPSGDISLFFPVKAFTAIPIRVASSDDALFPDLAALHAERLGLRPDPMAGQLTDLFIIEREAENTALLSVLLRPPIDGDLPTRGPKAFDISPRAYPMAGDSLAVWKEFGRWVFAFSNEGNLVYCQATSVSEIEPDASFAREIRLALMQLSMQGLAVELDQISVWTRDSTVTGAALKAAFGISPDVIERPAPTIPSPLSKLLPADVRAARRLALRRQNIFLGIAAVALLYVGIIGWFGFGLWKDNKETAKLLQEAADAAPEGERYTSHITRWDELVHAIDLKNSPVEILYHITTCIPPNSGLRLTTADISAQDVKLNGEARELQAANTFSLNLNKNADLSVFSWQTPESNQSTKGWDFVYSGETPVAIP